MELNAFGMRYDHFWKWFSSATVFAGSFLSLSRVRSMPALSIVNALHCWRVAIHSSSLFFLLIPPMFRAAHWHLIIYHLFNNWVFAGKGENACCANGNVRNIFMTSIIRWLDAIEDAACVMFAFVLRLGRHFHWGGFLCWMSAPRFSVTASTRQSSYHAIPWVIHH